MRTKYITPAVTLFQNDGSFDLDSQKQLYEHLIKGGVDGILVLGSIGEFFALPMEKRRQLARFAIHEIGGRVKTLIGTASMVPEEIVPFSNDCLEQGADGAVIVPPYYFRMEGRTLEHFFDGLLEQIHGPTYLYNFPDRTGYTIPADMVLRLRQRHSNLAGIKDTIAGMDHTRKLIETIKPYFPDFEIYSGFDENAAHNVLAGGDGCIGGLSNIFPEICSAWANALRADDLSGIRKGQRNIDRLMKIYGIAPNFIPVIKEGVRLRGIAANSACTFPLEPVTAAQSETLQNILRQEGYL